MKKKIPFSLDYKEKIESGEVSVVTRAGSPAWIISWNADDEKPIIALVTNQCNGVKHAQAYNASGVDDRVENSSYDLFLLVEDDELNEFEKAVAALINGVHAGFTYSVKGEAEILLDIARKQLDDENEYCTSDSLRYAMRYYNKGKKDALKDMPKWERATEDLQIGCLVWDELRNFHLYMDRVSKGELYISMADILRLPGSPKEGEE